MSEARPRLLVDDSILAGTVNLMPRRWLDGFEVATFPSGHLGRAPEKLRTTDALLVRSVSPVTPQLLAMGPMLRAVGTTSSGTDHIDLGDTNLPLFTGRGGNAIAVTDWVQWVLTRAWTDDYRAARATDLTGKRVIVVGCGAVGAQVSARLAALGGVPIHVDPPRGLIDPAFSGVSLDEALEMGCDAITLHTPLIESGPHRTRHLLDRDRLLRLGGAAVLNAARGDVLDAHAAAALRRDGLLQWLALDVFPNEPNVDPQIVANADLATPHIGGHSIEGKLRVSARPVAGLAAYFGTAPIADLDAELARRRACPPANIVDKGPFAALDEASHRLHEDPHTFRAQRGAHWRRELPTSVVCNP